MFFLQELIDNNYRYSVVNTAKLALALIIELKESDREIVRTFMKGFFHSKQPKPRYTHIWDVSVVLGHITSFWDNNEISHKKTVS